MLRFGIIGVAFLIVSMSVSTIVIAPQPQITFVGMPYHEGDTVTVQWSCDVSTTTMQIVAWMSGVEVHRDTVSGKTQGLETFVAPMSGLLNLRVSCIDSEGRGTGNDESISIHPVVQDGDGDSNEQNSSDIYLPMMLLFIIISIILLVVVVALAFRGKGV